MSIDTKEWATKRYDAFSGLSNMCDSWLKETAVTIDLIRAVIADEAAKAQQPDEPRAVGDVPEKIGNPLWDAFLAAMSAAFDDGIARTKDKHKGYVTVASRWWPQLTRRVAEATAELQAKFDTQTKCAQNYADEVADLKQATADKDARHRSQKQLVLRALGEVRAERDALKQQLAASQAEVERVRKFADAMEDEVTKLREENARLTRPVEDAEVDERDNWFWASERDVCKGEGSTNILRKAIPQEKAIAWVQRERNAREAAEKRAVAAETERDEANVLIDEMIERLRADEHTRSDALACWKCSLYHKLAAYRAEKGKVTK